MGNKNFISLFTPIKLQASFFTLLGLLLALHGLFSCSVLLDQNSSILLLSRHRLAIFSLLWCTLVALLAYISTRPRPVLLLGYACFRPEVDRKCSYEVSEYFVRRSRRFTGYSEEFMRGIYLKSGLGDETYAPPFIFQTDYEAKFRSAMQEAEEGMTSAVDTLLVKTGVPLSAIDLVIVSCGMFSPCPSLASMLVHHYGLPESTATYNLSGMGCSSGVASVDLAARILSSSRRIRYALVVVTESISLNWYFGDDRSMLVTNCIFRVGTAAALVTNDPTRRSIAKMELIHSLRTHHGADDAAYGAAYQREDEDGNVGVALKKDLIRVAGEGLRAHIRILAPKVLPWWQLAKYACRAAASRYWTWNNEDGKPRKPVVPDFEASFEHMCVHTGGKAVIESVARVMGLSDETTEPARMCLHRFGNTSSSLVFYEYAYFEAKGRVKAGDRMWMLAFGTGFKVCSLVWRAVNDSVIDPDNPWKECIHRYPLKTW